MFKGVVVKKWLLSQKLNLPSYALNIISIIKESIMSNAVQYNKLAMVCNLNINKVIIKIYKLKVIKSNLKEKEVIQVYKVKKNAEK